MLMTRSRGTSPASYANNLHSAAYERKSLSISWCAGFIVMHKISSKLFSLANSLWWCSARVIYCPSVYLFHSIAFYGGEWKILCFPPLFASKKEARVFYLILVFHSRTICACLAWIMFRLLINANYFRHVQYRRLHHFLIKRSHYLDWQFKIISLREFW